MGAAARDPARAALDAIDDEQRQTPRSKTLPVGGAGGAGGEVRGLMPMRLTERTDCTVFTPRSRSRARRSSGTRHTGR